VVVLTLQIVSCSGTESPDVRTGADLLLERSAHLLRGKRIGLVANHTALLSDGRHLADVLASRDDMKLVALFGPEHGIRGDTTGPVRDTVDQKTGVPVYSLYGTSERPSASALNDLDILVFDIQDVGARFYTYISTMGLIMESAAERGIPVIICDRPNPVSGIHVEGPVAEDSLRSFVAFAPIPIVYGLTVGELALMYNGEGWLKGGTRADLRIEKMEGWRRTMWFDATALLWVRPSPNMLTIHTAVVYPGTCLLEGTNISEGRGTDHPFEVLGAPWLDAETVAGRIRSESLPGLECDTVSFMPGRTPSNSSPPKYEGRLCRGLRLRVTERNAFRPVRTGIAILRAIHEVHPDSMTWRLPGFDLLAGTSRLRAMIEENMPLHDIEKSWQSNLEAFRGARQSYLLYRD
jgi:uncharacterized protein YbbC (DUF1343 family)